MLELLSGRRALADERDGGVEETLVDWAKPFLGDNRRVLRIMDSRLGGQYYKKGAQAISSIALKCLHTDPKHRPPMIEVLAALEEQQLHTSKEAPRMVLPQEAEKVSYPRRTAAGTTNSR